MTERKQQRVLDAIDSTQKLARMKIDGDELTTKVLRWDDGSFSVTVFHTHKVPEKDDVENVHRKQVVRQPNGKFEYQEVEKLPSDESTVSIESESVHAR